MSAIYTSNDYGDTQHQNISSTKGSLSVWVTRSAKLFSRFCVNFIGNVDKRNVEGGREGCILIVWDQISCAFVRERFEDTSAYII